MSLAKLGDLDQDGYDDLAIGAPYDQHGGSVFIFRGGPNGIDEKPSQIIKGNYFYLSNKRGAWNKPRGVAKWRLE